MANKQKPSRKALSLRAQVVIVIGVLQILALSIALHGYLTLQNYQKDVNTTLNDANQIQHIGASIEAEVLMARQNESTFMNGWRVNGLNDAIKNEVQQNQEHMAAAKGQLNQLKDLVGRSTDPQIQPIKELIPQIQSLIFNYEQAFHDNVILIKQGTTSSGLENSIARSNDQLFSNLWSVKNSSYLRTAINMQQAEQDFLRTRRQEYYDSYRIQNSKLLSLIDKSSSADLTGSQLSKDELYALIDGQYKQFEELVKYEQSIDINSTTFTETSEEITQILTQVTDTSSRAATITQTAMTKNGRQAAITIMIATIVVIFLGTAVGIIFSINLARPIIKLTAAANEMGTGKLDERVSVRGPKEVNQLAEDFNHMADRLAQTLSGLEERVEERTRALARRSNQLQASAEVARDATSIHDLDVLLNQTANLIRDRFGFYHAGIFLADAKNEYAVLKAATGDAGRSMLERNHKLKIGEVGIVGTVCSTGEPRISLDVGDDAVHFRNPLLPETRSEMALPLRSGRQIIGAIDVQSKEPSAFDEQDVAVLQSMADQLAVAIENARLFQESQENIHQLQTIYGSYSKQAWENITVGRELYGYSYEMGEIKKLDANASAAAPVSVPLKIRGEVIGSLEIWPEKDDLSAAEKSILEAASDRIGQAMESARLYEDAQYRASREKSLSQLTALFTQSLSFDTILKTAVQELGKMPNVSEASIQIEMPSQDEQ